MELAAGTFQCFRAFLNAFCSQQRYIDEAKAFVFEQTATLGHRISITTTRSPSTKVSRRETNHGRARGIRG